MCRKLVKLKVNISRELRGTREIEEGGSGTLSFSTYAKLNPRPGTPDYLPASRNTVVGSNTTSGIEFPAQDEKSH